MTTDTDVERLVVILREEVEERGGRIVHLENRKAHWKERASFWEGMARKYDADRSRLRNELARTRGTLTATSAALAQLAEETGREPLPFMKEAEANFLHARRGLGRADKTAKRLELMEETAAAVLAMMDAEGVSAEVRDRAELAFLVASRWSPPPPSVVKYRQNKQARA